MDIRKTLENLGEEEYGNFISVLVPTIDRERILGVRIPVLRRLARSISGTVCGRVFMKALPHLYLEENNLHALMISEMDDQDAMLAELELFLPYVDNWETSDIMNPKSIVSDREKTRIHALQWLESPSTYARRYAMTTFMKHYLRPGQLDRTAMEKIAGTGNDDYYVMMAAAWYWAEALAVNTKEALPYLEGHRLNGWIWRKAISKACESRKTSQELKKYLKNLQ